MTTQSLPVSAAFYCEMVRTLYRLHGDRLTGNDPEAIRRLLAQLEAAYVALPTSGQPKTVEAAADA